MRYRFPEDLSLDEVRTVVNDHNEALGTKAFIEADRGDHVIFNYIVSFDGSFPEPNTGDPESDRRHAILRECRGITFDKASGKVLSRKFQKYFNLNERDETQSHVIDWNQPHVILDKLDGSMITPLMRPDGSLAWCTKMGMTDVAKPVAGYVELNPGVEKLCRDVMDSGFTPIFEWCSRKQRIVIDYPVDRLVLTAVRDHATGSYLPYPAMVELGARFGVEVVRALPGSVENIEKLVSETRALKDAEGYVIRFDDGHMIKLKADEYVRIHKLKETLQRAKDVWAITLEDNLDDLLPMMDDSDRDRVQRWRDKFWYEVGITANRLADDVRVQRTALDNDRKRFAIEFVSKRPPLERGLLFSIWEGKEPIKVVSDLLRKYVGSSTKVEEVRPLVGNINWDDYRDRGYTGGDS